MPSTGTTKLAYLRVSREIIPSDPLLEFLSNAADRLADYEFAGNIEPVVYAARSLRVTLFERRAATAEHITELRRLENYLQGPKRRVRLRFRSADRQLHHQYKTVSNPLPRALEDVRELYANDEGLYVRANRIVDCTKDDYRFLGAELALQIEPVGAANLLIAESGIYNDQFRGWERADCLPPGEPDQPLLIPFMRAPFEGSDERDDFIDVLRPCLPVYGLGLKGIDTVLKQPGA